MYQEQIGYHAPPGAPGLPPGAGHPLANGGSMRQRPPFPPRTTTEEKTTFLDVPPIPVARPPSRSIRGVALLSAGLFIAVGGLLVGLGLYIAYFNDATFTNGKLRLLTTADTSQLLTITQVTSKVSGVGVAPLLALYAWSVAAGWVSSSEMDAKYRQRPTPVQLGVAMSVLGGANIRTFWSGFSFVSGASKSARRHKTASAPPFLTTAVLLLAWLLLLEYGISITDTVLHATAETRFVPSNVGSPADVGTTMLSRRINQTKCDAWKASGTRGTTPNDSNSCGWTDGGNNQAYIYLPQGLATLSNTSATDSVAWTDKGTAIFVNATGPAFAYRASSVSLSASCESITDQCATCGTVSYDNGDSFWECRGPEAALTLQCNGTARYNATMAYGDYQYGLLDDTYGNQTLGTEITNNPFHYGNVITSFAYTTTDDHYLNDTGFLTHGHAGGYLVVYCALTAGRTTYEYRPAQDSLPAQYVELSTVPSPLVEAGYLAQTLEFSNPTRVAQGIEGVGRGPPGSGMRYVDAYAQGLAKYSMAMATLFFEPAETLEYLGGQQLGSDLSFPALATFFALNALFGLTALALGISVCRTLLASRSPLVSPTRAFILSSLPILNQLYGRANPEPGALLRDDGLDLFASETEDDRLKVGPEWDSADGGWRLKASR